MQVKKKLKNYNVISKIKPTKFKLAWFSSVYTNRIFQIKLIIKI